MYSLKEEDKEKVTAILRQLKGLSMAEAYSLLDWCKDYLTEQIVIDFTHTKSYVKENGEGESS